MAKRVARKETRGQRNVAWIEAHCVIPEGKDVGKPVRLRDWQKDLICQIYDNPAGTRRAIISFGRKNAKTTLSAFLLLLHLVGPEARPNSQLRSAAQSRDQAAILFALAAKMVRMSATLQPFVVIRETVKELVCPQLGTEYKALSADAATAYGLSPVFIVHDEIGQVRGPRSELYEALETAVGAQASPLSIVISTQAPTDADLLSVLIDDAKKGSDPRVVLALYTAPMEMDPFGEAAIREANPAFGDFLNATEVISMAEDARRMPSREPNYRNLVLNQRVEAAAPFVSRSLWSACAGDVGPLDGVPVFAGLDLSATADLTALVLIGKRDGVWHVEPHFWLPADGIADKARADRVPYDLWADEGHLHLCPGRTIGYDHVGQFLRVITRRYDVRKIAYDRWGLNFLKPWLLQAGFDDPEIEGLFAPFGQGFASMSPALRSLEAEVLNAQLRHPNNPVLNMCMMNARIQGDAAGNRKLDKMRSAGRIDGAVALAQAFGVAPMDVATEEKSFWELV